MFGKRGEMPNSAAGELPLGTSGFAGVPLKPAAARAVTIPEIMVKPQGASTLAAAVTAPSNDGSGIREAAEPQAPISSRRSDNYYDIKSTIFNALIDAIDLTQLGQLDRESARERDPRHRQRDHRAQGRR